VDEYMAGRTPNPCVLCNTHIKWNALLKRADALDCEFIATGHYAIIEELNARKYVKKAVDNKKDQSYVLWGLSQECLHRSKFPLGPYTKPEVRKMAHDWGYAELSKKAESFEICFVPDNDYRGFFGTHSGYPFYTVGQRRNLGKAFGKPMYVTEIRPKTNTVVLGDVEDLIRNGMTVRGVNFMKYPSIPTDLEVVTKVRYKDNGTLSTIKSNGLLNQVGVEFHANVRGIAPGQSAVFYEGDDVVGGGIIQGSAMFVPEKN